MSTRRNTIAAFGLLCGFCALLSCGTGDPYENYNLKSTADLTLTSTNHPHGYKQSSCFSCHVQNNIHQVDRLQTGNLDLARQLVSQSGISICWKCHGNNGVGP